MDINIRPDFLLPQPPPNVSSSVIDFTATTPALPGYKDCFAAVIDNFMTEDECRELLSLAEHSTGRVGQWDRAMVNAGNGKEIMAADYRNCGRIILDSHELAGRIFARLLPFFRQWGLVSLHNKLGITGIAGRRNVFNMTRLNERLRFLKYVGGEYFLPHCDGSYETPDGRESSLLTVQLYLNGEGEEGQNLSEFSKRLNEQRGTMTSQSHNQGERENKKLFGGTTSFIASYGDPERAVRVFPKTGRVLVFQHRNLWHSGDTVYEGTKYAVRAEVLFSKDPLSEPAV